MRSNLPDVNVDQYRQPPSPQGQNLINDGTGELTHKIRRVGSVRRELLDQVIPLNEYHLRRDYVAYYHGDR